MMVGCHSKFSNGRHEKFSSCVYVCACVYLYIYMFQKCYENIDKQRNFGKFDATEYRRCGAKLEDRENTAVLKFYDYRLQ